MRFRFLALLAVFAGLLTVTQAHAQPYYGYNNWCEVGGKTVITAALPSTTLVQQSYPKCTVSVYLTGTSTLATIYPTPSGGTLGNPFTAATDGSFLFFADAGQYDVTISGAGISPAKTFTDIQLGSSGGSVPAGPAYAVNFANSSVTAFQADSTITANPTTHALIAPIFTTIPTGATCVFEGDSRQADFLGTSQAISSYLSTMSQFKGCTMENVAVGGSTITTIASRYAANVKPYCVAATIAHPAYLFLIDGYNDFAASTTPSSLLSSWQAYATQAESDGCKFIAETEPPYAGSYISSEVTFEQLLRENLSSWNGLVDLASVQVNPYDTNLYLGTSPLGVHPNATAGNQLFALCTNWLFGGPPGTCTFSNPTNYVQNSAFATGDLVAQEGLNYGVLWFGQAGNAYLQYNGGVMTVVGISNWQFSADVTVTDALQVGPSWDIWLTNGTDSGFLGGGQSNTGSYNWGCGGYDSASAQLDGNFNLYCGTGAGQYNVHGSGGVYLGNAAGVTGTSANANVSGNNDTWVGNNTGPSSTTQVSNSFGVGNGATNSASNQGVLGNASVTDIWAGGPTGLATVHGAAVSLGGASSGSYVKADGTGYGTPTGTGTVTHTAGALTSGKCVIGNGSADITVDPDCSTDGAGNMTTTSISLPGDGVHPGHYWTYGNTTNPTIPANVWGSLGPTTATFTSWVEQPASTTPPTAGQVKVYGAPSLNVSTYTWQTLPPANIQVTVGTTTVSANSCLPTNTTYYTATLTGLTTSMGILFTPSTDFSGIIGWNMNEAGQLYFNLYPTAGTVNYQVCNGTGTSITPGSSTVWNVSAK